MASANVETVFSGAGRISLRSRTLDPQLLSDYAYLHYNYKYEWLRPTLEEILTPTSPHTSCYTASIHMTLMLMSPLERRTRKKRRREWRRRRRRLEGRQRSEEAVTVYGILYTPGRMSAGRYMDTSDTSGT